MSYQESQSLGRLRLRRLLETTEAVGDAMASQRGRFAALAKPESAPRVVSSFNLFQTPPELAARLVGFLDIRGRVLEPSAGLGRLYRAVRDVSDCEIVLVEESPECCAELYGVIDGDAGATLVQGDFLACTADRIGTFDLVVMNPPFKQGRDIKHVNHARSLLRPGGKLAAICANGPRQQAQLKPTADEWIPLPTDAFSSEGTHVSAAIAIFSAE